MKITFDIRKSVDENAQAYFEVAKKARRKASGAEKALQEFARAPVKKKVKQQSQKPSRKAEWYEKFRWCFSSDGFLLIGGRDATTNEAVIKHHTEPADLVFHTDMAGSPFVIVKAAGKDIPQQTKEEAAEFCAAFSRAWQKGMASLEVFHVLPEQVTKEANAGEHLAKGAFMIRGKTTYLKPIISAAIGVDMRGRVMAGPPNAVAHHCEKAYVILQGTGKSSDVAKELEKLLGTRESDELVRALPSGGVQLGTPLKKSS